MIGPQATPMESGKRRSVLSMTDGEARAFFLKGESYCNFDLPPYFEFDGLLGKLSAFLRGKNLKTMFAGSPREHDDINYVILNNKDGRFAWRPSFNPTLKRDAAKARRPLAPRYVSPI